MLEKGVSSFVFLWVLNPIVILFYQNCSWSPAARSLASSAPNVERQAKDTVQGSIDRFPYCSSSSLNPDSCRD